MAKKECFRMHNNKKVKERRCSECTDVVDCMVYSIDTPGKTVTSENTPVRKGCFGNYQAVISSPRKCGVCMDIEECIYETEIRNALDVMRLSDEPSCKKGCFRDFRADIQSERKCIRCVDFDECTWPSDIQKEELVGESRAVKLDNGKRKYSLIIPSMMELLLPTLKKDHLYYWLREAIMELSRASHSTNQVALVMRCHGAVTCIQKYVNGSALEYYAVRTLDELALAMEYGANKPEYGRNNWKKGMEWSRLLDAGMRHGVAILMDRQDIDKDSGNTHVAHMLGSIHMLMGNLELGVGTDDITIKSDR